MEPAVPLKFILNRPRSGLELIGKRPKPLTELSQDELEEFARRLEADDYTFDRYYRGEQLRVWQLLALHHCLDPAVLDLNRRGRLGELKQVALKLPPSSAQLHNFVLHVPFMLKDINQGILHCVKATGDLLQSFTTPEQFKSYVMERRLSVYPQRARKKESVVPASLPKGVNDMIEGHKLWQPADQGGGFVPGNCSTEPDLVQFFLDRGYSAHKSTVMASLLRPSNAHIGRPPKKPSYRAVLPGLARSMRKA